MKLRIKREDLLAPLQRVIGAVEKRQTLPALANVLLVARADNSIAITATDLELELLAETEATVEAAGEITLPARKLLDICRTLAEGAEIRLDCSEGRATVRAARSRFSLATLPAAEFPALDEIQSGAAFKISSAALKHALEKTAFSMAQQDVRYYLNGLLFEVNPDVARLVATDGHRLAMHEIREKMEVDEVMQVIVPRKGVHELQRLLDDNDSEVDIQLTANHVRVLLPGLRFTSKLIDGRFPDYQRVMPQGGDKHLFADREGLRQALQRASILSNEKYKGIRMVLGGEELKIQTHNPDQEEAEEEFEVEYRGDPLEIGFNVTYLLDILANIEGERVQLTFKDTNSSCLVEDAQDEALGQYVVMPMRL
jgi:DNA polymerase-3 subunit beta